jgi:selenide,water dikinase
VGEALGKIKTVTAMTDVTGFGLLGHLCEMADGSNLSAVIPDINLVPLISKELPYYISQSCVPGGTHRNWDSYGHKILIGAADNERELVKSILADPQTSGGLLVAVAPEGTREVDSVLRDHDLENHLVPLGYFTEKTEMTILVG